VGVQSFDDRFLKALGRVHERRAGAGGAGRGRQHFDTFNLDLMYALPGQTLADLDRDLDTALGFNPPHLSVYHLTIEPNTWFASQFPPVVPDDDTAYAMLDRITERTAAGRAGALRGVGLRARRPPLLSQLELLAVWRLPGHRDALTGGAFSAPTSGERRAPARVAGHRALARQHGRGLQGTLAPRPGAAKPLKEKLDELKRAKAQERIAAEWAPRPRRCWARPA
jgi:hypothetical protein